MPLFKSKKKLPEPIHVPDSEKVSVALIGVGHLGQHHARLLSANPYAQFVGIVDQDAKRGQKIGAEHGIQAFSSWEDLPETPQAAIIATPTPSHFPIAQKLLQQGVHCFIEKPLTDKMDEAEALIELSQKKNLVLQVGHVERFNPAVVEMAKHAQEPLFIEANRLGPYDPRTSHVGVVLDLMIHDIDIVLALVRDRVVRLDAVGGKILSDHEDIVKATLFFKNGCRADLTASRVTLKRYRKIRVIQRNAYMSLDYSDRSLKIFRTKGKKLKSLLDVSMSRPRLPKSDPLGTEQSHFLQCVKEGKTPLVSGQHGRDALELAFEILKTLHLHTL